MCIRGSVEFGCFSGRRTSGWGEVPRICREEAMICGRSVSRQSRSTAEPQPNHGMIGRKKAQKSQKKTGTIESRETWYPAPVFLRLLRFFAAIVRVKFFVAHRDSAIPQGNVRPTSPRLRRAGSDFAKATSGRQDTQKRAQEATSLLSIVCASSRPLRPWREARGALSCGITSGSSIWSSRRRRPCCPTQRTSAGSRS